MHHKLHLEPGTIYAGKNILYGNWTEVTGLTHISKELKLKKKDGEYRELSPPERCL